MQSSSAQIFGEDTAQQKLAEAQFVIFTYCPGRREETLSLWGLSTDLRELANPPAAPQGTYYCPISHVETEAQKSYLTRTAQLLNGRAWI